MYDVITKIASVTDAFMPTYLIHGKNEYYKQVNLDITPSKSMPPPL